MAAALAVDVALQQKPILPTTKMPARIGVHVTCDDHDNFAMVMFVPFVVLVVLAMFAVSVVMVFVIMVIIILMARKRLQMYCAAHAPQCGQGHHHNYSQDSPEMGDQFHGLCFSCVIRPHQLTICRSVLPKKRSSHAGFREPLAVPNRTAIFPPSWISNG
ncbi:MAG: hypothetical protein ACREOO_11835 [bacterium]